MFSKVITNYDDIQNGYVEYDGYIFTCVTHPANIYDGIVIRNTKDQETRFHRFPPNKTRNLQEHIEFINKNKLKKAVVYASDLDFLRKVPSLEYLSIHLYNEGNPVDYSPIYDMPCIKFFHIDRVDFMELDKPVDYLKINGLLDVGVSGKGHNNYEKVGTLRSLHIGGGNQKTLHESFCSKELDQLQLIQCKISTLDGIETSEQMQCVYLYYNRLLSDISALKKVKKSLKALRIENCPKITDFSVLWELENLEMLELVGKNTLESLDFISKMEKLKTFIFSMEVLDGDITPCLGLSYVFMMRSKKYYNLKDKELPKGEYVRGNEDIEMWRRMDY